MPGQKKPEPHEYRAECHLIAWSRLNDAGYNIGEIASSLDENGQGVIAGQWHDCLVELETLQAKMKKLAR